MFVKAYNEAREHGGINGFTPSEMFLQKLITSTTHTKGKQKSVTHVNKNVMHTLSDDSGKDIIVGFYDEGISNCIENRK